MVRAQGWRKEGFGNVDGVPSEVAEVVVEVHLPLVVVVLSLLSLATYQIELATCDHGPSDWSQSLSLEPDAVTGCPLICSSQLLLAGKKLQFLTGFQL